MIVEPVSSGEIAEFLLTAYQLTAREREIVRLAVGRSSKEVAHELRMSRHTVREHIETVLAKVGVHSSGELIGKLFVEPSLDGQGGSDAWQLAYS